MHPFPGAQTSVTSYGLMLVAALATCWWLGRRNALRAGADPTHIDLLVPLAFAGGLLASWLAGDSHLRLIPLIAAAIAVVYAYARLARLSFAALLDVLAVPTLAAIAIQRFGCILAGCCWGKPIQHESLAWLGLYFPPGSFAWEQQRIDGVLPPEASATLAVHATQLYEALPLIAVAIVLGRSGPRSWERGQLTLVAIAAYAAIRFGVEFLRADSMDWLGPLSTTQLACMILIAGTCFASRIYTTQLP